MLGQTLGRYHILESVGAGGMGQVYLAEDPTLARRVAIKVLPPAFAADKERRSRLLHEARAASGLNHPNIVTVHDLGDENGVLYVAMEWIDGQTLAAWARAGGHPPLEILRMVRQATRALSVAHAAGLVHRDLKPDNLMVRQDGLLKILDFGLARSASPASIEATMTAPGTILGTAPYMSPEQVLGQAVGPASDVFSLGTVLYEMLTGKHPFAAATAVETMHRILHEVPPPPSTINRALPADVDFVVQKALAKESTRRYAGAQEFDVDLETCERALAPAPASTAKSKSSEGPRSLAVLPFKNIGGNPELNYLGVGLADAVITRLSESPDLVVRATSSIARYENQVVDPLRVALELEVGSVLDASFQRAGERFRATARLVEAPGGRALWAGKVDLKFDDIFEVQDQVAQGIAEAMTVRLSSRADAGGAARFTPSPAAYEAFMRSMEAQRTATRMGFRRGIELAQRAVELEPNYADAWVQLGVGYHGLIDGGFEADATLYDKAGVALERALALDPTNPMGQFAIGNLHLVRGRKREAYRAFVAVHKLLPHHWAMYHYVGYLFRLCDMLDEALAAEARCIEVDPSVPWGYWSTCRLHLIRGDLAAAEVWVEKIRARFGHLSNSAGHELGRLRRQRRYAEAAALSDNLREDSDGGRGTFAMERAFSLLRLGRVEEAAVDIELARPFAMVDMDSAAYFAALMAQRGDRDAAFRSLERAVELGNDTLTTYLDEDAYGPLHDDPRWEPFIAGVRARVAGYRRDFRWPLA